MQRAVRLSGASSLGGGAKREFRTINFYPPLDFIHPRIFFFQYKFSV
jgi:hypothetical protein